MVTNLNINDYTPEQVHYVAICAAEDAARVVAFIEAAGLQDSNHKAFPFPPQFLLDLGAAFRLLAWERLGIRLPPELGSPCARQALLELILRRINSVARPRSTEQFGQLATAVFDASVTHFVWCAKIVNHVDVLVVSDDEDELFLTALAKVLWSHRSPTPFGDA